MANTITVQGKNALDTKSRTDALHVLNALDTDALNKLKQMATPKGVATLKNPMTWAFIKTKI